MNKYGIFAFKYIIIFIIPLLLLLEGCRPKKEIAPVPVIPEYKPDRIIENIKENQSQFDWFSARFTGDIITGNQRYNISGTLRIKKDEIIYLSISPILGIEIARAVITPDTVKFLNRIETSYYIGDIRFINSMLGTSLNYDMLEALLIGNDFSNYDNNSFITSKENGYYLLNNPARKPLVNKFNQPNTVIDQSLWVDSATYRIMKNLISDPSSNRMIRVAYDDYEEVNGKTIPAKVNLVISEGSYDNKLSLQYMRISINEPQQINFSVPSRYKPMDF